MCIRDRHWIFCVGNTHAIERRWLKNIQWSLDKMRNHKNLQKYEASEECNETCSTPKACQAQSRLRLNLFEREHVLFGHETARHCGFSFSHKKTKILTDESTLRHKTVTQKRGRRTTTPRRYGLGWRTLEPEFLALCTSPALTWIHCKRELYARASLFENWKHCQIRPIT